MGKIKDRIQAGTMSLDHIPTPHLVQMSIEAEDTADQDILGDEIVYRKGKG